MNSRLFRFDFDHTLRRPASSRPDAGHPLLCVEALRMVASTANSLCSTLRLTDLLPMWDPITWFQALHSVRSDGSKYARSCEDRRSSRASGGFLDGTADLKNSRRGRTKIIVHAVSAKQRSTTERKTPTRTVSATSGSSWTRSVVAGDRIESKAQPTHQAVERDLRWAANGQKGFGAI